MLKADRVSGRSHNIRNSQADTTADSVPQELLLYENLKQKSHLVSLRYQLKFMLKPDLRRGYESYISQ